MSDNSSRYLALKIGLRRRVIQLMPRPINVLDLFSGRGQMYVDAWRAADGYLGVDMRSWRNDEPHHRIVMNNHAAVDMPAVPCLSNAEDERRPDLVASRWRLFRRTQPKHGLQRGCFSWKSVVILNSCSYTY